MDSEVDVGEAVDWSDGRKIVFAALRATVFKTIEHSAQADAPSIDYERSNDPDDHHSLPRVPGDQRDDW